jgi:hypothetical protein
MPLTMGRREYSDAEIQRMQREAEDRVREMQERTKQAAARENGAPPQTGNRNWNHWSGARRVSYRTPGQQQEQHRNAQEQHRAGQQARPQQQPHQQQHQPPPHHPHPHQQQRGAPRMPQQRPTVLEELMRALELDEDYLLILGLMLILINQRADTTIILALAYLLI